MFGARRCWCATASLLAQLAFAATGHAVDLPNPVIVSSNTSDARMTRALVLIRGELSALGLDVRVRPAEAPLASPAAAENTSERLTLDVKEGVIVVRVFTAGASAPLVESVDLDGPDVTAEVIAVRAVEALRAARLLPSQASRIGAPTPRPEPPTAKPPAAERPPAERPPAERPPAERPPVETRPIAEQPSATPLAGATPTLQLSLGPTLVQNSQARPQLSAQAAIRVGPHWGFVALGAEGSLSELEFERKAGSAQVSRRALFMQLGARLRVHHTWELNARGGVSYIHYAANGMAEPGYLAQNLSHDTGAVSLSLGGAYYFVQAFGVYLDASGLVAFDAAHVRVGDDVLTLDRPSLAFGTGVLLGAF